MKICSNAVGKALQWFILYVYFMDWCDFVAKANTAEEIIVIFVPEKFAPPPQASSQV